MRCCPRPGRQTLHIAGEWPAEGHARRFLSGNGAVGGPVSDNQNREEWDMMTKETNYSTMEKVSIAGKEAKKHIQDALKVVFPGFKFSLTSDYDSVHVSWTDGPLVPDVEKVLNRFESYTRVLWKTDYTEPTGYEWKGMLYVGPRHLSTSRRLSEARKERLIS